MCDESWSVSYSVRFGSPGEMTMLNGLTVGDLTVSKAADERLIVDGRGQDGKVIRSRSSLSCGRWYHIAVVTTGDSRSLYIDGEHQGAAGIKPRLFPEEREYAPPLFIGSFQGKRSFLKGSIDELAVYNGALPQQTIRRNAHACEANR